jgi:hypothetical protein
MDLTMAVIGLVVVLGERFGCLPYLTVGLPFLLMFGGCLCGN